VPATAAAAAVLGWLGRMRLWKKSDLRTAFIEGRSAGSHATILRNSFSAPAYAYDPHCTHARTYTSHACIAYIAQPRKITQKRIKDKCSINECTYTHRRERAAPRTWYLPETRPAPCHDGVLSGGDRELRGVLPVGR
jgi:hypothetical protein